MTTRARYSLLPIVVRTVLCVGTSLCVVAANAAGQEDRQSGNFLYLEREVERQIQSIMGAQLKPEQYIIIVESTAKQAPSAEGVESKSLPYTTLQVDEDILKDVMRKNRAKDILAGQLAVRVIFDKDVPEKTRQTLSEKVRKYLALEGANRTLDVTVETISPPPPSDDRGAEIEAAKIQLEKTKLEMERSKLEATQQAARLEDTLRRAEDDRRKADEERKKAEEEAKKAEEEAKKAAEEAKLAAEKAKDDATKLADQKIKEFEAAQKNPSIADRPLIDIVKEFQLLLVAIIAVFFALIGVFLAANFHKSGLRWLSDAVGSVGEGINNFATAQSEKGAQAGGLDAALEATQVGNDSSGANGDSTPDSGKEVEGDEEQFKQFLLLVEQKIDQLSKDGNFNFFRHFTDLIESDIKLAASLLLSLTGERAKDLLTDISQEYIDKVRDFLSEPSAIENAKKMRAKALQEFYGRLTLDEFMDSPLLQVKDASWLFRLSNSQLIDLAMDLEEKERVAFLACFTPNRLALIVQDTDDDKVREKLLSSIKDVDQITADQVPGLFERIRSKVDGKKPKSAKRLIDGPSFFAKMLVDLKPENRSNFLTAIGDRKDIMAGIQKYYIPFETVARLAEGTLKALFAKRPTNQLAIIMFSASEAVREKILSAVPEMLRESLTEELDSLVSDEVSQKRNRTASLRLQEDISRQMLGMSKQGILDFASEEPQATPIATRNAA